MPVNSRFIPLSALREEIFQHRVEITRELFYCASPECLGDLTSSYDTLGIVFTGQTHQEYLAQGGPESARARHVQQAQIAAEFDADTYFCPRDPARGTSNLTVDWALRHRQWKIFQEKNFSRAATGDLLDYNFYLVRNYSRAWGLVVRFPELAACPEHQPAISVLRYLAQDYRGCLELLAAVSEDYYPAPAREFLQGQVYCKLNQPARALALYEGITTNENAFTAALKLWLQVRALEAQPQGLDWDEYHFKMQEKVLALGPKAPRLSYLMKKYFLTHA